MATKTKASPPSGFRLLERFANWWVKVKKVSVELAALVTCVITVFSQLAIHYDFGKLMESVGFLHAEPFPADGVIATFQTSNTKEIRTALAQEISILSDCAKGGTSTLSYGVAAVDQSANSDGFLRLRYQLNPPCQYPYAGVFSDFSNILRFYDISAFKKLRIRLKSSNALGPALKIHIFISDANVKDDTSYAWAQHEIDPSRVPVGDTFASFDCDLKDFQRPVWSNVRHGFDLTRVFRFGIVIVGSGQGAVQGELDIDDIRLLP